MWATDINTTINQYDGTTGQSIRDRVTQTETDISGINSTISEVQSTLLTKADGSTVTNLSNRVNTISDTVDGHTQTISNHTSRLGDAEDEIETTKTTAEQTANKFTWLVDSGTSSSNFTLTDRTAQLVANYINLNGTVTFSAFDADTQNALTSGN